MRMPAHEARDVDVPLELLWGRRRTERLRERLLESANIDGKLDALETALCEMWRPPGLHPAVTFALARFDQAPLTTSVAAVTDAPDWAQSGSSIASSSKWAWRQNAIVESDAFSMRWYWNRGCRIDWTDVALDCGYFDQAHFIHDFQRFAGLTPAAYQAARTSFRNHVKFLQSGPDGIWDDDVMADSKDTYRTVTPYLLVPDADHELAFVKAAFGGTEVNCQRNADNAVMHAEITIGNSLVMLGQAGGPWKPHTAAQPL
jgi:AraC-like DNA-binding protein